jgi:hypothetical protein
VLHDDEIELLWQYEERRGPHVLRLTVGLVADRAEVVGFEMWAVDPVRVRTEFDAKMDPAKRGRLRLVPDGCAIQALELRVPVRKILAESRGHVRETARVLATRSEDRAAWMSSAEHLLEVLPDDEDDAARGRRSYGRPHYRAVAEVYLAAQRNDKPPTSAVAEHWRVNKSTAGKWVSRARAFGFLAPTSRGKSSSAPTSRRPR